MSETFPELPPTRLRDLRAWSVSLVAIATMLAGPMWSYLGEPPNDPMEEAQRIPDPDSEFVLSGRYAKELEKWLLATSPASLDLRAHTIALQYLLGVENRSSSVVEPVPGWLFQARHAADAEPSSPQLVDSRRAFLNALGRKSRELGVRCVIAIGPDKARAYPEILYPDGEVPPGRAGFSDVLRTECEAAGIDFVDPLPTILDWKRRAPAETSYLRMDTHWTPTAAVATAIALAEELGLEPTAREPSDLFWHPEFPLRADLVRGMRGLTERSFLGDLLFERRDLIFPGLDRAGIPEGFWNDWSPDDAQIAFAGDSFSPPCAAAVQAILPVPVDLASLQGGSLPESRAAELITRIESGDLTVDTIVLIHVERNFLRAFELPEALR